MTDDPIATQGGHWYAPDGKPSYTVTGANGKERPATLRDARKLGLVPSVTKIIGLLDKPGLNQWREEQVIMSALTLPRHEGEYDAEFIARVKFDSRERTKKAAERGTDLHTDIERAIQGKPHGHEQHVKALVEEMAKYGIDFYAGNAEKSFAHHLGFGGKVDFWL